MNLETDPFQTQTPKFVDMGLSTINALHEGSGFSNPVTRIRISEDGSHWSTPNHIFGQATAVGVIEAKSD